MTSTLSFRFTHLIAITCLLLLCKVYLALQLELFGDEAFYWLEAQNLALAYSDQPFMTALWVKVGTALFGDTVLGTRALFLLLGSALPFATYFAAKPLLGSELSKYSALLSVAFPLTATLGVIALPDVPLTLFSMLALGCFIRAVSAKSSNRNAYWIAFGVFCALGMTSHYRFSPFLLAAFLYLVLTHNGRAQWKTPALWLSGIIALVGFIPVIYFNLAHDFSGVLFHLQDRHPWEFNPRGLMYPVYQFLIASPAIFILFFLSLGLSLKQAIQGDDKHALTSIFSLVYVLLFFGLAPWADQRSTTFHWSIFGYLPAIIWLPYWLQKASARLKALAIIPLVFCSFFTIAITFTYLGVMGNLDKFSPPMTEEISAKMAGWQQAYEHTQGLLSEIGSSPEQTVYSHYYSLAQFSFYANKVEPHHLSSDTEKSIRDGRYQQLIIWQQDAAQINPALNTFVILDASHFSPRAINQEIASLCQKLPTLQLLEEAYFLYGRRHFLWLTTQANDKTSPACHSPSYGHVDEYPENFSTVNGNIKIKGWVSNDGGRIQSAELTVDHQPQQTLTYGAPYTKALAVPIPTPPSSFSGNFDTTTVANGWHLIQVMVTTTSGKKNSLVPHWVYINNTPTQR